MVSYNTYKLKKDGKVVYIGQSNQPRERARQHSKDKNFDELKIIASHLKKKEAEKREEKMLAKYRSTHNGKNPKYNKTSK